MNRRDPAHARYREGAAKLAFGQSAAGRIVHVRDVPSGLACGCLCPACGGRLIARRGERIPHFAHERDASCIHALETMLHLLAKEVLQDRKRLRLPAIEAEADGVQVRTHPAREMSFETVVLEQPLAGVIPDIIVRRGDRDLLVEIYVTHGCDDEKVAKIRALGISAMEIDLRKLPRNATRADVETAVISAAPRRWLFNPWVDEAARKVQEQLAAKERVRLQRLDRDAATLVRHWDKLVARPFEARHGDLMPAAYSAEVHGYQKHIGLTSPGQRAFNCEPMIWQAVLLRIYVLNSLPYYAVHDGTSVAGALATLRRHELVASLFDVERPVELLKRVRGLRPAFRTPQALIRDYFTHLTKVGLLEADGGRWRPTAETRAAVDGRARELDAARSRDLELGRVVRTLLGRAWFDAADFDLDTWVTRHDPTLGATPAQLALAGGDGWRRLSEQLSDLERAFSRDGSVPPLIGLPLGAAIRRAAEERAGATERRQREAQTRAQAEIDTREARLRQGAQAVLGLAAEAWLNGNLRATETTSRLDATRHSDKVLFRLLTELDQEQARRQAAIERAQKANTARNSLRRAAIAAHGDVWAAVFLSSTQPRLGGRPVDICVDEMSLRRCLALIPSPRSGRRSR